MHVSIEIDPSIAEFLAAAGTVGTPQNDAVQRWADQQIGHGTVRVRGTTAVRLMIARAMQEFLRDMQNADDDGADCAED